MPVLRIADHRALFGEIGHRIIALEGETLVAGLRNRARPEENRRNETGEHQQIFEILHRLLLFHPYKDDPPEVQHVAESRTAFRAQDLPKTASSLRSVHGEMRFQ